MHFDTMLRRGWPGFTLSNPQFCRLAPEIIIITSAAAWPVNDVIAYCLENNLDVPAVESAKCFLLHPYRSSLNHDWMLGLLCLAYRSVVFATEHALIA